MASVGMIDLAKTAITPIDKNLRYLTALQSPVMGDARMKVIDTQAEKYVRYVDNYGTPSLGNLGEGFTSIVSKNEQLECTTFRLGFNIDVDRDAKSNDQIVDPRVQQLKAGMIGYGAFVSGKLFEADPAFPGTGVSGKPAPPFKGIKWYLDFPLAQDGARLSTEMKVSATTINGGSALDLRPPISSANARAFLRVLDTLRYKMYHANQAKRKIVGYLPSEIMIALPDIMRTAGAFRIDQDSFGREVYMYGQIELKDAGLSAPTLNPMDPATSAARVFGWEDVNGIRNDALIAGAGTQCVSAYFLEWGEDALMLYSKGGQTTRDLGLLNDGVTFRTQVSDMLGLAFINPWCAARAFGFVVG